MIQPSFSLNAAEVSHKTLISISKGSIGYAGHASLLCHINLSVMTGDRIAIKGNNGRGKSTLIKAILNDSSIIKSGSWYMPKSCDIGYLDQHYGTLLPNQSVIEALQEWIPSWTYTDIRRHLHDFLFRKNEEVNARISTLSGGEKAKLSLAQIAAKTPALLILDEITNNLDLETREHVIQILKAYPGTLMVISHDEDFLKKINMTLDFNVTSSLIV